ncbi:LysR family transcriptional regulator [Streptomyces sp. RFCAC02]|uniref:LysR family transcriptional regulator n=1 Tax=Streptomyces sp. RFCAC02 TaxID=2499143 RepID=UPI001F0DA2D0|nr:LysR family transcriptional regulator [Streptomyces sp. RFCAC02]
MTNPTTGGAGIPPHTDLNQLRTFLAVYRAGSLTAAAPLLGLSQPTVTTQIRALERRTGRELFTRSARGVEPTAFAHELAGRLADPLDALVALEGTGPGADDRTVPVYLAGPAELLCTRALPALAPLVAGGLRLRVATGLTDPLLDELRAGRHDLVISTRRVRGRALVSVPLADEEFVLVAAPVWALPADGDVCAAVRAVPLVTYADDLPIARRYWRTVFGRRLTARAALTVPDLRGVVSAVAAGAGCAVVPRYLCEDELASGRLVVLHEPAEPPINTVHLAERPGAGANPCVVRVRERLREAARAW